MKVYKDLLDVKSFIVLWGIVYNSQQTKEENEKKIEAGEDVLIVSTNSERTWFTDVIELPIKIVWSYAIGDKDTYTVIEDWKERAEKEAEEHRKAQEELDKLAEEPNTQEEPIEEVLEDNAE